MHEAMNSTMALLSAIHFPFGLILCVRQEMPFGIHRFVSATQMLLQSLTC